MDIYTIGGGEIVYEVLKAVAMCLNGGSGTLQALLRMGGFTGAFIVYYMILYGNIEQIIKTWGIPVLLITNMLFVPTTSVWVQDTITKYHYKIDRVPYGLALFASQTSRLSKAVTEIVEQNFAPVDDLKYQKNGMMFGSDILEKAKTFRIQNQDFRENIRNFVGQCVKYDIMLNQKYSIDDLRNTSDIWGLVSSNPSRNRGIFWIPISGKAPSTFVTCAQAVEKFNQAWRAELDHSFSLLGRKFFSGRFVGNSGSNSEKFQMNPGTESALKAEIKGNLQNITSYLGDIATNAEETLRQALLINAILDSASENSKAAGNAITYAETRALQQQNNTFDTIGRLATKLLPIMKAVIEALAYACFIFVIPLCMIPQGYKFLINWIAVLAWLQVWPPMYAILNCIMNIAARAATLSEIGTAGGLTIANCIGVSEANSEMKLLAGYLAMSIPFICIAIVQGVGSFVHLAGQMTGASTSSAGTAAGEISTGNFSFGNVSMRNQQLDNLSHLQRNYSSSISAGGHTLDTGAMQIRNDASGFKVVNRGVSSGISSLSSSMTELEELRKGWTYAEEQALNAENSLNKAQTVSESETVSMAHTLSSMTAQDIASRYNFSIQEGERLHQAAQIVNQAYAGKNNTDATTAGISIGGGGLGIGASMGANSTNATNSGSSKQASNSKELAKSKEILDSFSKDVASSNRNDEVTQLARNHSTTLSQVADYSKRKSYWEKEASSYQESYNKASSRVFSEGSNMRQIMMDIADKEGVSAQEAARIIDSFALEDLKKREAWVEKAKAQMGMQSLQSQGREIQNRKGFNKENSVNTMEKEFDQSREEAKTTMTIHDQKMNEKKNALAQSIGQTQNLADSKIKDTTSEIAQKKEEIKNDTKPITKVVREREGKVAVRSVIDTSKNAISDFDESIRNEGLKNLKKREQK